MEHVRRPAVGYAMVLVAGVLFGLNGAVSKVALTSGMSALRLTEARSAGAFIGLTTFVLVVRPGSLRLRPGEWWRLAIFGVVGVAFVQLASTSSLIERLPIGIGLLIRVPRRRCSMALWARSRRGTSTVRRRDLGRARAVVDRRLWRSMAQICGRA